jgi:hypothetical protein
MVGGALAIAALSLHWYKRHSQRGCRQWGGVGDPPQDLALDNNDGFNEPEEELRRVFNKAAKLVRLIPGGVALDQRDQLMLYKLYKQSMEGDRNKRDAPSNLNVVAFAKI